MEWIKLAGEAHQIGCSGDNTCLVTVNNTSKAAFIWTGKWKALPDRGQILSCSRGFDGTILAVKTDNKVYRLFGETFKPISYTGTAKYVSHVDMKNIVVINDSALSRFDGNSWSSQNGNFKQVEMAQDGTVAALGSDGGLWLWPTGATLARVAGEGTGIALGASNHFWHCNSAGRVYRWEGDNKWTCHKDITAFALTCDPFGGLAILDKSNQIFCSRPVPTESSNNCVKTGWRQIPGTNHDIQISVGSSYMLCGRNKTSNNMFFLDGPNNWVGVGQGLSLSASADRSLYCIGLDNKVKERAGGGWQNRDGTGVLISVRAHNDYVVLDADGFAWRYKNNALTKMPGSLMTDLEIGFDGTIFCVNKLGKMFIMGPDSDNWVQVPGVAYKCGVGSFSQRAHINEAGHLYVWKDNKWRRLEFPHGKVVGISCSYLGQYVCLTEDGSTYISTYDF